MEERHGIKGLGIRGGEDREVDWSQVKMVK